MEGSFLVKNGANNSVTQRTSLSFTGQPVAVKEGSTLTHVYADHLGSTGSLSNTSGTYIAGSQAKYIPFGDWRTEPTATAGDRYYTGHKANNLGNGANDLGLTYMNARFYLPNIGRFASADTIIPNLTSPQSFNRFSYTRNNPLNFNDPTGHFSQEAIEQYLQDNYDDWENILSTWMNDHDWWRVLLVAEAGDTLLGSYYGAWSEGWVNEGSSEYTVGGSFQFTFTGSGQNIFSGVIMGGEEWFEGHRIKTR